MKMKRWISILLTLALCLGLLPLTAGAAMSTGVYVGGVELAADTYYVVENNEVVAATEKPTSGYAHLTLSEGKYTLTLNGLTVSGKNIEEAAPYGAGIYSTQALCIEVEGTNTITGVETDNGDLKGIDVRGQLEISPTDNGGVLNAICNTSNYSSSVGISAVGLSIAGDSLTVNATGGASAGFSRGIWSAGLMSVSDGATVTATSGTAADSTSYGIYTSGALQVSSGSLTATGGTASKSYGIHSDKEIQISGNATVAATGGWYGISGTTLLVSDTANVVAASRDGWYGILMSTAVNMSGGTLTATAAGVSSTYPSSHGIYISGATGETGLSVTAGKLTATGADLGIRIIEGNIKITGGEVIASGATAAVQLDSTAATLSMGDSQWYEWAGNTAGVAASDTFNQTVLTSVAEYQYLHICEYCGTSESTGESQSETITIDGVEYTQMYVEDNGSYVAVAEGTVGMGGDIWLYSDANGSTVLNETEQSDGNTVYKNYNITCDESIGEMGFGLNGTNWRKGNVKPGAEGYIYAEPVSGSGTKYAIKATVSVNPELIYDDEGNSKFTVNAGMEQAFTFPPTIYVDGEDTRLVAENYNGEIYTFATTVGSLYWHTGHDELAINTVGITSDTTGEITITNTVTSAVYSCEVTVKAVSSGVNEGTGGENEDTPELMYRHMSRNNDQFYEDTSRSLNAVSNLSITYGGSEVVCFYYGTEDNNVPVTSVSVPEGSCMTVTECTTTDGNSTIYWELEGTDLGTATLSFVADGQTYSAEVQVILPDNGFYTSYTNLSKGTYLPDGFTYDEENDTFYLVWNNRHSYIPANSEVSINYWNDDQSGLVSAELVETDKTFNDTTAKRYAIQITVADTVSDDFGFEVNFEIITRDGNTETNNWGIRVTDNSPKLMYRYMNWSNGQPYEDTSRSLHAVSDLSVAYGGREVVRFYYGTEDGSVPVTSVSASEESCIAVTECTTTDGNSTTYWELVGTDLGTATLSFAVGSQTCSADVPVILPNYGFYTSYTELSKGTYLTDGFTYDEENDTFYLVWNHDYSYIPAGSEVSISYWNGDQSGLVSAQLVETGEIFNGNDGTTAKRYAIQFTVANKVSENFGFSVSFGLINRDGGTETNNWGIRIKGISGGEEEPSELQIGVYTTLTDGQLGGYVEEAKIYGDEGPWGYRVSYTTGQSITVYYYNPNEVHTCNSEDADYAAVEDMEGVYTITLHAEKNGEIIVELTHGEGGFPIVFDDGTGGDSGEGGGQGGTIGNINFREELLSDTRLVEDDDKITYEESERLENGPSAFQYDVNGDGTPETYYLCTMAPMYADQLQFGMAYAGGSSQPYDKDAHFLGAYCIGIWTYNAGADYYTLVNGETKDTLLAAFGDSWSVEVYNVKDRTGATPATSFPAVYSWTPADGWPIGRAFIHYADCIGSWDYVFTGIIGGKTVSAKAHCGYGFSYEHLEYDAFSVADANEKLAEWSSLKESGFDFMGDTTYAINLPTGTLNGIIEVPSNMEVDLNGSTTEERTVLVGGVAGDGCAYVRDIDFVGCGWQNTHWPNDDVYHGKENYGLSTVKGGKYKDCSFKNYFHALHCGPTRYPVPILIFGGEDTLFENNFTAAYLNSTMNGGGNMIMEENVFRHNGCALWMENTGNDFPMNSFALVRCKFYDNGWDVINLLGKCYFLPGQLFERDGQYGHGKFAGRRDALLTPPEKDAPEKAFHAAADVSEQGSSVYTFPVAKDDKFNDFDYTNKDAVIGNHNASEWLIPEKNLDGKTITVIQDDKGEDAVVWSFGEENK